MITCPEEQAWEFTAVALHLAKAQGCYCGTAGPLVAFMIFDELTLANPGDPRAAN